MNLAKDIKPISELKRDTAGVVDYVARTGNSVLITQKGIGVAMVVNIKEYQNEKRKVKILEALARGEKDVRAGKTYPLESILNDLNQWLEK